MKYSVNLVALVFSLVSEKLSLLIMRKSGSESSEWMLPETSLHSKDLPEETLEALVSQFGIKPEYIEQLYTFVDDERGSPERTTTIAYLILCPPQVEPRFASKGGELKWANIKRVPGLSEFQTKIKETALDRLRNKVAYSRIATRLLAEEFTLSELKNVYEQILDEDLDKRNFQKKIESKKLVSPTANFRRGTHRPARLYKRGPKSKNVEL